MLQIPEGYALCPVCQGSTRRPVPESVRQYANNLATYDKETDTLACANCGGQTMSLKALGYTKKLHPENTLGCKHHFTGRQAGNCYVIYTCAHCMSQYDIDSGD